MAIADTKRTFQTNYLRASQRERDYASGKQPSEFTSLRESGQLLFPKALASVLSASPKQIQDSRAQAKIEKPSPHTKYTYDPAKGRP